MYQLMSIKPHYPPRLGGFITPVTVEKTIINVNAYKMDIVMLLLN